MWSMGSGCGSGFVDVRGIKGSFPRWGTIADERGRRHTPKRKK